MKYAKIMDEYIPQIAIGTWSWGTGIIGGNMIFGNHLRQADILPVYQEAIENGFTLFDTAPVYGMGAAEKILGSMIKESDKALLSTKFMPFPLLPKKAMAKSLEGSLKRLKVSQADIFWIHLPRNVNRWTNEIIPILKANKIKYVGVSNHNFEEIQKAKDILEAHNVSLAAVQNHFSLLYQTCNQNGILSWCKNNDVAFFSYMVLEQGALTSRYNVEQPFPKHTRRGRAFPPETLQRIEPIIQLLKNLANKYGVDVAEVAIAYAINKGTIPIVGVTKTHHVASLKRALEVELSVEEINLLEATAKLTNVKVKGFWENRM